MSSVGIRDLRDGLSRYLAEVREGRTITVTDRGRPIVRIVPVEGSGALERLIAEGLAQPAKSRERRLPDPMHVDGTVSDLIAQQRR